MDQSSKEKVLDQLTKAENICIATSKTLGIDGLAAALGLYLSLIKLGKKVSIIASQPSVGDAFKVYGVDKIGRPNIGKDLMVVVDDAVQSVEKVTYFLDGDKLKVVIHALGGSSALDKSQVSIQETQGQAGFIFSIGFDSLDSLRNQITHEQSISPNTFIVDISNKSLHTKFAHISFIDPQATSISELIARLVQELALPVDEDIAYNFYTGLAESTENFLAAKTRPQTLEIAGWLLKFGAGKASFAQTSIAQTGPSQVLPQPQPFLEKVPQLEEIESKQELKDRDLDASSEWLKPPKIYKGSKSFDREN